MRREVVMTLVQSVVVSLNVALAALSGGPTLLILFATCFVGIFVWRGLGI